MNKRAYDIGRDSVEGIASYLVGLHVPGIGKTLSRKIAELYRQQTVDTILNDHQRIAREVTGIGKVRVDELHKALSKLLGSDVDEHQRKANDEEREAEQFWGALSMTAHMRYKIEQYFGDHAARVLLADPYRLTEIDGIGFRRADEIAARLGITGNDERRVHAGICYALEEAANVEGHCCLPLDVLIKKASSKSILNTWIEDVINVCDADIESGRLIADGMLIYLPRYYEAETEVAERLKTLQQEHNIDTNQQEYVEIDSKYNDRQREAIIMALVHNVMILTGGPGTGKTYTLKGMLRAFRERGLRCALCAPTGRAAKRMSEATGETAQTIHRLLEYQNGKFNRNEDHALSEDVIICDESSMIDLMLMRHLLRATMQGQRLILIGDVDQLPSVGAGHVLGDLIASGSIPTVRLTEIYRQQEGSYIIYNAREIINGRMPYINNKESVDFFFDPIEKDNSGRTIEEIAAEEVVGLVSDRLPNKYPGEEIQVLCPMRKDDIKTGVTNLNKMLQKALNADGEPMDVGRGHFRQGDRVMQTKNNYQLEVFNGDIGVIEGMDYSRRKWYSADGEMHFYTTETKEMQVCYDTRRECVGYDDNSADELELAYATTIHKSQGSEYDIVVIVLMQSAYYMLQRNLLYTAVTRARKRVVIVGEPKALSVACASWNSKPRYTGLSRRMG